MKYLYIIISILINFTSCTSQNTEKMEQFKHTNNLINQTSPYLLQHAHNPVDWYPWGNEALDKAKKENKMLLISIGYSACHWCHVMEHESFEDEAIAKLMNDNFVCIKVDREERPDIDQIYMDAVQLMTGRGGWPLNCFALPDGSPFYGGTYFPKSQWEKVLSSLADSWKENQLKIVHSAEQLKEGIKQSVLISEKNEDINFDFTELKTSVENWKTDFDKQFGGNLGAPKFPMPTTLNFLLNYYFHTQDKEILNQVENTLQKMAFGGIYDQIGGGFARYSTDKFWRVPHFEKMLYDNAQLIELYSNAYKLTKNDLYKKIVFETIEFVERELYAGKGIFYSSLDADSDAEEGKFYVWSYDELQKLVPNYLNVLQEVYEISKAGNWENKIIFHQQKSFHQAALDLKLSDDEVEKSVSEAKKILFETRKKRIRPGLDDKSITSWNAMMISGLCSAYNAFEDKHFLDLAVISAKHIQDDLIDKNFIIYRNYKNKNASIIGFLDDYAFTIKAFIELFQITGNVEYFNTAENLTKYVLNHFMDKKTGLFYYTPNNVTVPVARKFELTDGVIPSSSSVMAQNLFILSRIGNNSQWNEISKQQIGNLFGKIHSYPSYFANWASLELNYLFPTYELAICGENAQEKYQEFAKLYQVNIISAYTTKKSDFPLFADRFVNAKTLYFLCEDQTCKMPVENLDEVLKLLK